MMGPFLFPDLDPVLIQIGPLVVRWYALAYIVGLLGGRWWGMRLAARARHVISPGTVDGFLLWALGGVIIGGRLGQVLFYYPEYYLRHPLEIVQVWRGGMSFHGGLLGVAVAAALYVRRQRLPLLPLADILAVVAPLGLLLGRLANFVNQELWGRVTDVPWAVIFPRAGPAPRHPSQLYEAGLEGAALLLALGLAVRYSRARFRPGLLCGMFLAGYAVARILTEWTRAPEILLDVLPAGMTYGQLLSLPMLVAGVWLIRRALVGAPLPER